MSNEKMVVGVQIVYNKNKEPFTIVHYQYDLDQSDNNKGIGVGHTGAIKGLIDVELGDVIIVAFDQNYKGQAVNEHIIKVK